MCVQATFGPDKTWIIGQYTYTGVVTAASDWGQPHADVPLRAALPDSYEGQLHILLAPDRCWSLTMAPLVARQQQVAGEHAVAAAVADLLRGPPRLQRWVGVSYVGEKFVAYPTLVDCVL